MTRARGVPENDVLPGDPTWIVEDQLPSKQVSKQAADLGNGF
jgi:hypothetical protein